MTSGEASFVERSETHRPPIPALMGFAALYPSYEISVGDTPYQTGNAIEYFTWLSAKLDSIEAMPSSRVSLFFRKAS